MKKGPTSWYYFTVDHDQKLFSVEGSISTDQALTDAVYAAQEAGRKISSSSCSTLIEMQSGMTHWLEAGYRPVLGGIVEQPKDRSVEYKGVLSNYAKAADRSKVVKLRCGRCHTTRFAEMTVKYPGQESLRGKGLGTFEAKCLMCGAVARDPYNWYR